MGSPVDLTTLATAKGWLSITNNSSDAVVARLITAVSSSVLSYLQRPSFQSLEYIDRADGWGTNEMLLRQWPVTAISAVRIGTNLIPQVGEDLSNPVVGWLFNFWSPPGPGQQAESTLALRGRSFVQGTKNVSVSYTAGYCVQEEAHTLAATPQPDPAPPLPPEVSVTAPWGSWIGNIEVTYADGTPMTYILSGTPAQGQYKLSPTVNGGYIFSVDDDAEQVLISYSYCPADVEQVVLDMMGERYTYRQRFGVRSQSLAGQETISFMDTGIPDYARDALAMYRRLIPA
jgi:hypothetical protein